MAYSGTRRDLQLRGIRLRARHPRDSPRRALSSHRCGTWLILPGRTTRTLGQDWLRDMSYRICHHRATCAAGQRGRVR